MGLKKNNFAVVLVLLFFSRGFSQEGLPVYFDYLSDNHYLVHPAMAGVGESTKVRLTVRQQWFDIQRAPSLQTLNVHTRIPDTKSGIGAIVFNDANGYHSQTGLKLTYAHHLLFFRDFVDLNQLSFGLSAGFIQSRLDESEFISAVPDPVIDGTENSVGYFNVDAGVSYNYLDFYAHFTVRNIIGSGRDLYSAQEIDNLRRYLLSVGYAFGKSEWYYEPSVMLQLTEFTEEKTVDANIKVYKEMDFGTLWGGLSYRRSFDGNDTQELQLLSPILGINYKNLIFAYTYSYQTGDVRIGNGGFHQLTLGYNFWKKDTWRRSKRGFQRVLLGEKN
ncbi:MAG: type IX secretion system membrane protein PorP/SprF [Bacteroidota bacterium]